MRKRDIRRHSPLSLSKNVALAETSYQRLEVWSFAIRNELNLLQAFRVYFFYGEFATKLKLNLVLVVLLVCVDIEMNEGSSFFRNSDVAAVGEKNTTVII